MRFCFRKMRSTTVLIFVLAFMTTLYMTMADDQQCMCSCCSGDGCTGVSTACFNMTGCDDTTCTDMCKKNDPTHCNLPDSKVEPMCMPYGSNMCMSAASQIFNRYTTLGAFILVFIATAMFRIWLFSFLQWCIPRFFTK